jgi:hypothetical protein
VRAASLRVFKEREIEEYKLNIFAALVLNL